MSGVLLVKMSSLGDVIHNLPVATDIRRHRADLEIDWVVEEQYVPLVRMHPAVDRIIPIALRRWRRAPWSAANWRELGAFRRELRRTHYEAIIETQGLLKSALVAKLAHGPVTGFGPSTAREPLASRLYDQHCEFPPSAHKILRYRSVAAQALGYDIARDTIDYGIAPQVPRPDIAPEPYCLAFHSTARAAKLWDEDRWTALLTAVAATGCTCVLPWGSEDERRRSERIAATVPGSVVPGKLDLDTMAALIAGARFVVGVDTGLMHLAAALSRPVVGIFCDSNPVDACPIGPGPTAYRGHIGQPPTVEAVIDAIRTVTPGSL